MSLNIQQIGDDGVVQLPVFLGRIGIGDNEALVDRGKRICADDIELALVREDIGFLAMKESSSFYSAFLGIRCRESFLHADAVGAEKTNRKIHIFTIL